jgi:hypothetical protein
MVERALRYDCRKIQLFKGKYDDGMIAEAKKHGIICNLFYADDPAEAAERFAAGADTVLTNRFHTLSYLVKR